MVLKFDAQSCLNFKNIQYKDRNYCIQFDLKLHAKDMFREEQIFDVMQFDN